MGKMVLILLIAIIVIFIAISYSQKNKRNRLQFGAKDDQMSLQDEAYKEKGDSSESSMIMTAERGDFRDEKKICKQYANMLCKSRRAMFGGRQKCERKAHQNCLIQRGFAA